MRQVVSGSRPSWLLMAVLGMGACTRATSPPQPASALLIESESSAPQLGNWHDMIFHDRAGRIVLVNGGPETGNQGADPLELWGWNGEEWSLLSADTMGPRWRNFASIAYASGRQVLVQQQVATTGPSARFPAGFAYAVA